MHEHHIMSHQNNLKVNSFRSNRLFQHKENYAIISNGHLSKEAAIQQCKQIGMSAKIQRKMNAFLNFFRRFSMNEVNAFQLIKDRQYSIKFFQNMETRRMKNRCGRFLFKPSFF